jgi:hypothetical protein
MSATFINHSTHQPTTVTLSGDFWGGSADIAIEGGPVVAQIRREVFNMRQVFGDKQTVSDFDLIPPGLDPRVVICTLGFRDLRCDLPLYRVWLLTDSSMPY